MSKTILTFIFWLFFYPLWLTKRLLKFFWLQPETKLFSAWGNLLSEAEGLLCPCPRAAPTAKVLKGLIQAGVGIPRSQMLLEPALLLGLPGQSLDHVMDKMQGEILQGDVHFLVLTTSARQLFAEKVSYFNKNIEYWILLREDPIVFLDPQITLLQCYQGIKVLSQNHFYVKTPTLILKLIYLFGKNFKRKYSSATIALAGSVIKCDPTGYGKIATTELNLDFERFFTDVKVTPGIFGLDSSQQTHATPSSSLLLENNFQKIFLLFKSISAVHVPVFKTHSHIWLSSPITTLWKVIGERPWTSMWTKHREIDKYREQQRWEIVDASIAKPPVNEMTKLLPSQYLKYKQEMHKVLPFEMCDMIFSSPWIHHLNIKAFSTENPNHSRSVLQCHICMAKGCAGDEVAVWMDTQLCPSRLDWKYVNFLQKRLSQSLSLQTMCFGSQNCTAGTA